MESKAKTADTSKPAQINGKSPSERSSSKLTPNRHSRIVEKTELRSLNDRLASYIDRVRILEHENARLNALVQTSTETVDREIANNKKMYEDKLSETGKLNVELASEKSKLEFDVKRLLLEKDELKQKCDKKVVEAQTSEDSARLYESKYNEIINQYNAAVAEHKKSIVDAENMKNELIKLRKQFEDCRNNLAGETAARVDFQNTVRSLREELQFKDQLHNGELNETKILRQVEFAEANARLGEQYQANLQASLQELRDQYEEQMRMNRDEIESLFDKKIKNGQAATIQRENKTLNATFGYLCSRVESVNARIGELEQINSSLNHRVRDLQFQLDGERARTAENETEMNRLREEMASQLEQYRDLMDIKVSLDLEIAAYGKLLGCEEHRFKIRPSSFSHDVRGSPAAKRNRKETFDMEYDYIVTSSATGDIEIADVDPADKFVKLHNKSNSEVALGGWKLVRKAANSANVTVHKFNCMVKVDGGADLMIWSAESNVPASLGNITLESQNWFVADEMKTLLVDDDGKVVASTERIRQQRLSCSDDVCQNGEAREKCAMM